MCKQNKCSQSEIDDWIVKYGVHESGAMGAYSKVVKLTSTPNSAQQQSIVHAVAKALGQDSTQTMAQIRTLAREGGFCKAVCTAAEISHWANERGKDLPPPLSTFAVAIAETGLGATAAADAVAEALGQDPSKLRAEASDAAFKAGFCKEATCTTSELSTWAASEGTKLTGGLGAYVSTLYSSDATTSENPEEILHKSGMCKKKIRIFFCKSHSVRRQSSIGRWVLQIRKMHASRTRELGSYRECRPSRTASIILRCNVFGILSWIQVHSPRDRDLGTRARAQSSRSSWSLCEDAGHETV